MIRGTTAQFKFSLPYDFSKLQAAKVVFWQPGNSGSEEHPLPIYKSLNQCYQTENPKELLVYLKQEETLRFSDKSKAYVQLSATTNEGSRFASHQELITVYPIYDDSILGDDVIPTPGEGDEEGLIILNGGNISE